jgi:hypothetical protein
MIWLLIAYINAMQPLASWLLFISGASFLMYGFSCLFSRKMKAEFTRFGLPRFRVLVGCLEVAGGAAQMVHGFFPGLAMVATGGLCLLMLLGVGTRIKIGDSLVAMSPAFGFMALNAWLLFLLIRP